MKYFISDTSAMVCSDHSQIIDGYKEVTEKEYINFLASSPIDEQEQTEKLIMELVEKGYTVYK